MSLLRIQTDTLESPDHPLSQGKMQTFLKHQGALKMGASGL